MDWDCGLVELGGDGGGSAEVGEVGGEAVADVDAGGGEIATEECFASVETGLWEEVRVVFGCGREGEFSFAGEDGGEFGGCSAELAGDVEGVAGAGCGAAECSTAGGGADEDDVGEDEIRRVIRRCRRLRGGRCGIR